MADLPKRVVTMKSASKFCVYLVALRVPLASRLKSKVVCSLKSLQLASQAEHAHFQGYAATTTTTTKNESHE